MYSNMHKPKSYGWSSVPVPEHAGVPTFTFHTGDFRVLGVNSNDSKVMIVGPYKCNQEIQNNNHKYNE